MRKRPLAVTIIAGLLIIVGVAGFAVHTKEIISNGSFNFESILIPVLSHLASVSGIFILLGHNWARWLALIWMAFHVAISFFDSWQKVAVHVVIFALIAYVLFCAAAQRTFASPRLPDPPLLPCYRNTKLDLSRMNAD